MSGKVSRQVSFSPLSGMKKLIFMPDIKDSLLIFSHLGPTKSDLHTEDEAISNYNSPSLHSSTKRPNGRQVVLETSFRANGGQRVDLHRSQSTFLTPRNQSRTTCRGGTPTSCSSHSTRPLGGLEDSVSDHHVNGQAVLANSEPIAPTTITGSHLTSISLHSSSCLYKRKSIKSSEKRFQNRREKSIGILVCIITIFFACHLFQVGIQIFQICLPGHGLKDYYKECEQQKRSHVPAIIYTLGKSDFRHYVIEFLDFSFSSFQFKVFVSDLSNKAFFVQQRQGSGQGVASFSDLNTNETLENKAEIVQLYLLTKVFVICPIMDQCFLSSVSKTARSF